MFSPYQNTAKELCNALGTASKDRSKRNEQIEAVIEMIEEIRKWNTPSGLVLNSEMVGIFFVIILHFHVARFLVQVIEKYNIKIIVNIKMFFIVLSTSSS